jgi:hypothetical protein
LLLAATAGTAIASGPAPLDVSVGHGELTVDVQDVPLAEVLQAVAERAGVRVTVRGDFSTSITESFQGLPLEEGIRRLARGHSVAVTYTGPGAVAGIWVVARSSAPDVPAAIGNTPVPPSQGPAEAFQKLPDDLSGVPALVHEARRKSEAAVAELAVISASEADPVIRRQAVAALGRLKGPDVEPALTAALADNDTDVRLRAVRGLRGSGTGTSVQSLAAVLAGDVDPLVRLAALDALTSLPGLTMQQGLARAVADPDARVRDAAARGLAWWNAQLSKSSSKTSK